MSSWVSSFTSPGTQVASRIEESHKTRGAAPVTKTTLPIPLPATGSYLLLLLAQAALFLMEFSF